MAPWSSGLLKCNETEVKLAPTEQTHGSAPTEPWLLHSRGTWQNAGVVRLRLATRSRSHQ